jgi:hypothetical protein
VGKIMSLKLTQAKLVRPYLYNKIQNRKATTMAQVVDQSGGPLDWHASSPRFNLQYHKKQNKTTIKKNKPKKTTEQTC